MPYISTIPLGKESDIITDYQDGMKVETLLAKHQISIAAFRHLLKRKGIPKRSPGRPKPQLTVLRVAGGPPMRIFSK